MLLTDTSKNIVHETWLLFFFCYQGRPYSHKVSELMLPSRPECKKDRIWYIFSHQYKLFLEGNKNK